MVAVGLAVDGFGVGPVYMVLAGCVVIAGLLVSFNQYIKQLNS